MKKVKFLSTVLLTFVLTLIITIYNVKITNVNNGLITISFFGIEQNYYFEEE